MTLVTLDQLFTASDKYLTVPVNPAKYYREKFGMNKEQVGEREYYVTRDEDGRAFIGPVRHRVRRPASARSRFTQEYPSRPLAELLQEDSAETVDLSKVPPAPPSGPQKPSRWSRVKEWAKDRWYDKEWHEGARQTAGTFLMWSFTVCATVMFVKGMLWVITL